MQPSYAHSNTFGSLKSIKEGIVGNLTSVQYLSTLDLFLHNAIELIHRTAPSFAYAFASKAVARQTLKPATKYSRNERGTLPTHLFNLLVTGDIHHFFELNLNRGLLFGLISEFLCIVNTHTRIHNCEIKATVAKEVEVRLHTQDQLGMDYAYNLYAVSAEVRFWEAKAQWFKSLIVQKYVRMALMHSQGTYKELKHSYPLDDIIQIYLTYLSKAIDRCDTRQGVLTTFITSWFKSARAEAAQCAKDGYHKSYEAMIENGSSLEEVLPDTEYEALEHIAAVAKSIDQQGIVRASLHIPEFLSSKQKAVLQLFIVEK